MSSVAELAARFGSGDLKDRLDAAEALRDMGPAAAEAVPAVAALLRSPDEDDAVGNHAAWVLGRIGGPAIPALVELLGEPDGPWDPPECLSDPSIFTPPSRRALEDVKLRTVAFVRRQAAWALGEIGAAARSSVEPLRRMLGDANPHARRAAGEALAKIEAG